MEDKREQNAVNAYYKLLSSKGGDDASMRQRDAMFAHFLPLLKSKEPTGNVYRDALEQYLDTQQANDWPARLSIAREYYPFWRSDIKAITHYASEVGYDLHPVSWLPEPIDLNVVWESLAQEKFSTAESWALKSYTKAMKDIDVTEDVITVRSKMAKIILMRLRQAPIHQNNAYRITVDATTALFEQKNSRKVFSMVAREFYYFWSGNPDAKEMLFKNTKGGLL